MENELICSGCSKSIRPNEDYAVVKTTKQGEIERVLCADCRDNYVTITGLETESPNLIVALIAGIGGAVVSGLIWYFFVTLTGYQIGIISILMGWLVGRCVIWGAGNKRGKSLQILSLSLTVVAILFSEYLILNHYFIKEFGDGYGMLTLNDFIRSFSFYFTDASGLVNLLFYAIALWRAYITPRKSKFTEVSVNRLA